jgi:hypothetical protein
MRSNLATGIGHISSISDNKHVGDLSSCNKTGCLKTSCVHACSSCHYGGGLNTNKSYAADFTQGNAAALTAAAKACDSNAWILPETNPVHLHISVSACPKN